MRFSRILVSLFFLLFLVGGLSALEGRLGDSVQPVRQSVHLEVDANEDDFRGRTTITVEVKEPVSSVRLHALDIKIEKALLTSPSGTRSLGVGSEAEGIVGLESAEVIPPGRYTLDLDFAGPFNRNSAGLYKYTDQDVAYLSTQFEMTDARRAFPCFDEPIFKIPYQLTVTAPKAQMVVSNTPEIDKIERDDQVTHRFAETPPMPSYLVALAVGPYESTPLEGLGVPGRLVTTAGKIELTEHAKEVTPIILQGLEDYFAIDYPYEKLDQVAVTEFPYGAMENAGMVTYREDILLVNPATAQLSTITTSNGVIAHELAHQWFGNLVTMKWWNDLWLNEAFATWMAGKIVADKFPELESDLEPHQNNVMGGDARLTSKPIRKPIRTEADILDGLGLAYRKGESALSMVERWIGEEAFQEGMQLYMKRHRFGNAEASDLWDVLGEVSGKDVQAVLASFTEQAGYPLITLAVSGETLQISQERFVNAGVEAPAQLWSVPLRVRYGGGSEVRTRVFLLDEKQAEVELEFEPEWIMPDDGGIGYFRWDVSDALMATLLSQKEVLSAREKLATIHNINGLFQAGVLSAGESLNYVSSFIDDENPAVVGMVLGTLDGYGNLYVTDANRALWQRFLARTLEPVEQRYGLQARDGEHIRVPRVRSKLIQLMGVELQDPATIKRADNAASRYLSGENVDPDTIEAYLEVAAFHAGPELVIKVQKALVEAKDPQRRSTLLDTLGLFAQPDAHSAALALLLHETVTPSDLRYLLAANGQLRESRRLRLQSWLEANYPALRARIPDAFVAYIPLSLASARDQEQLDRILKFFTEQDDPNGAIGRALDKLEESVRNTIAARLRGQESFDDFLRSSVP